MSLATSSHRMVHTKMPFRANITDTALVGESRSIVVSQHLHVYTSKFGLRDLRCLQHTNLPSKDSATHRLNLAQAGPDLIGSNGVGPFATTGATTTDDGVVLVQAHAAPRFLMLR